MKIFSSLFHSRDKPQNSILRFLFGRKQQITIIVPGDSVKELAICNIKEGGTA